MTENNSNIGKILISQWGYEQTNIDFYVVIRETKSNVWIVPISFGSHKSVGHDEYHVTANENEAQRVVEQYQKDPKSVQGVEMHRKLKKFDELTCWINSFAVASEYHGEDVLQTTYY